MIQFKQLEQNLYKFYQQKVLEIILIIKVYLGKMEKLTRHRKAFYQKENDYKNGNQKLQLHRSYDGKYINQSYQHFNSVPYGKIPQLQVKKVSKNDTELYCESYSSELLNNLSNFQVPSRFLQNHKIDTNLRTRMLDWMVEVMTSYKFTHKTYFAGIQLMDRYFQKQRQQLQPARLHIIGVVSMMIASKMEQVYPLKLRTVYEKIGHRKICEEELVSLEERISQTLQFKLNSWTFFDLAIAKVHIVLQVLTRRRIGALTNITNNYFCTLQNQRHLIKQIQQQLPMIEQLLGYISKFLIYDYQFYLMGSLSLFSDVVLKLCFQLLKIPCQLQAVLTSPQIEVELFKEQLKQKIAKYQHKFKAINNLKKFTSQDVVDLVQKQIIYQSQGRH